MLPAGLRLKQKRVKEFYAPAVDYPKAAAPYEINVGNIIMEGNDLSIGTPKYY